MTAQFELGRCEGAPVMVDPMGLVDSRLLIFGSSGAGKSWAIRRIIEQSAGTVPFILFDPEGEFVTLRERVDALLVGESGEVPCSIGTARALCRRVVELGVSVVIDLYELAPDEREDYVRIFLEELMALPREMWRPYLVGIDEAHKFCPERSTGSAISTDAVIALMAQGRKRGFGGVLLSQRLAKLNKNAIGECGSYMVGRCTLDVDQRRACDIVGIAARRRSTFRKLERGQWFVFGPAFDDDHLDEPITVGGVETTHPDASNRHVVVAPAPRGELSTMLAAFADLEDDHAADDDEDADEDEDMVTRETMDRAVASAVSRAVAETDGRWREQLRGLMTTMSLMISEESPVDLTEGGPEDDLDESDENDDDDDLDESEPEGVLAELRPSAVKLLAALAQFPGGLTKARIRVLTGIATTGGNFATITRQLREMELITVDGDQLTCTDAGLEAAPARRPVPRAGEQRVAYWRTRLAGMSKPGCSVKIFDALVDARRAGKRVLTRDDVHGRTGLATRGGAYSTAIRRLRALDLVEGGADSLRLSSALFIDQE